MVPTARIIPGRRRQGVLPVPMLVILLLVAVSSLSMILLPLGQRHERHGGTRWTRGGSVEQQEQLGQLLIASEPQQAGSRSGSPPRRSKQRRLRFAHCNDTHSFVPLQLFPHIYPGRPFEFVVVDPARDNLIDLGVDMVLCERGATAIIEQKLARGAAKIRVQVPRGATSPRSLLERAKTVHYPEHTTRVRDTSQRPPRPMLPVVFKANTEPWVSGVNGGGADLMLDTKLLARDMSPDDPTLYVPYAFVGFGVRNVPPSAMLVGQEHLRADGGASATKPKEKFCAFIASYCAGRLPSGAVRSVFFDLLAERYKLADALGNCLPRATRNVRTKGLRAPGNFNEDTLNDAVHAMLPYKFVITFENSQATGYITEKLLSAKLAGAVPIYWGAPEIVEMFNPDAFVFCDVDLRDFDFANYNREVGGDKYAVQDRVRELYGDKFGACIDRVRELDTDSAAFERVRAAPLLRKNELWPWLDPAFYAGSMREFLELEGYGDLLR